MSNGNKSLNNFFAQIIDDKEKKTLVSASSIEKEVKDRKIKKMEKSKNLKLIKTLIQL